MFVDEGLAGNETRGYAALICQEPYGNQLYPATMRHFIVDPHHIEPSQTLRRSPASGRSGTPPSARRPGWRPAQVTVAHIDDRFVAGNRTGAPTRADVTRVDVARLERLGGSSCVLRDTVVLHGAEPCSCRWLGITRCHAPTSKATSQPDTETELLASMSWNRQRGSRRTVPALLDDTCSPNPPATTGCERSSRRRCRRRLHQLGGYTMNPWHEQVIRRTTIRLLPRTARTTNAYSHHKTSAPPWSADNASGPPPFFDQPYGCLAPELFTPWMD